MKYLLMLSMIALCFKASAQIVIHSGNTYDSSIVIKTDEYWDDIYKKCMTSTFTMQSGAMQKLDSDGGLLGMWLDSSFLFNSKAYEYQIWTTDGAGIYMLMKRRRDGTYWFKRIFSKGEETYEVLSVETKIDKVFRVGLGIKE